MRTIIAVTLAVLVVCGTPVGTLATAAGTHTIVIKPPGKVHLPPGGGLREQKAATDIRIVDFELDYRDNWQGDTWLTLKLTLENISDVPVNPDKNRLRYPERFIRLYAQGSGDYAFAYQVYRPSEEVSLADFSLTPHERRTYTFVLGSMSQPTHLFEG